MTLLADFRAASKLSVSFKEKFATPLLYATLHLTELPRAKLDGIVCGSETTHFSLHSKNPSSPVKKPTMRFNKTFRLVFTRLHQLYNCRTEASIVI